MACRFHLNHLSFIYIVCCFLKFKFFIKIFKNGFKKIFRILNFKKKIAQIFFGPVKYLWTGKLFFGPVKYLWTGKVLMDW